MVFLLLLKMKVCDGVSRLKFDSCMPALLDMLFMVSGTVLQYAKFVKPAFDDFVLPTKKYADVILPRGGDNHVAIDLIVQHIRTKLGQHDLRKIYPNVYVIQSTFQVCSYFLWSAFTCVIQELDTLFCAFFTRTYTAQQVRYVSSVPAKHHDSVFQLLVEFVTEMQDEDFCTIVRLKF
jgi:hypothetical protein